MKTPQSFPVYLPAVNRQLEHQAGLPSGKGPLPRWGINSSEQGKVAAPKQRLGEDFNDIIVSR
ncbi:hypothetical protein A0257_08410 [Hymenobacter psoromatis]|nr:hypothetical protein A0257_08410 [Hymenobacter psoromatis]